MIYQWEAAGTSPDEVVANHFGVLAQDGPHPVDRFAERLFREVAAEAADLDAVIRRHASRWSPERMSLIVRHLLRMAISEMNSGRTPPSVVIDETLEIGKRFAGDESTSFLNGVLDAVRKELAGSPSAREAAED